MLLNDEQLLRYSRQILLPAFDVAGQVALLQAKVLILGLGGLGSPAALYLASAGVGELHLADDDRVDVSNLQRQIIHPQAELGQPKVLSAAKRLRAINPDIRLNTLHQRLEGQALTDAVAAVDCVLDCSDTFATRHALNRACVHTKTPLISGAAIRFEGQISCFNPRIATSPCYACLYPETPDEALSCSQNGILAPVVGVVGSYQALEAIKLLAGIGAPLVGRLQVFDGLAGQWRAFKVPKDAGCRVCGQGVVGEG